MRCPLSSRPGHSLQITLPPEPITSQKHITPAPLTRACGINTGNGDVNCDPFMRHNDNTSITATSSTGGAHEMTPEVRKVNRAAIGGGGTAQTFLVTIPPGVYPGMQFTVNAQGQRFMVTCPANAGPNTKVRIVPPAANNNTQDDNNKPAPAFEPEPLAAPKTQVFEVIVPQGVRPNQPFTLMANGQRVLVTCPPNVHPGQKIRFQLPVPSVGSGGGTTKENKMNVQLSYKDDAGSSGWERTIRVTDMKFQWIRVVDDNDHNGDKKKASSSNRNTNTPLSTSTVSSPVGDDNDMGAKALEDMEGAPFDFGKAAYVRKLQYLEGNDARMRTGSVSLVPAQEAVVDSKLVDHNYHGTNQTKTLLQYTDICNVQSKNLEDKMDWFHTSICEELYTPWEQGHVKIVVRRHSLLIDSVDAIMALGRDDMRKRWRFEFAGEPGIEAGGLTREWFQLVTEQIFDPDFGLWTSSVNNQMSMQINAASRE